MENCGEGFTTLLADSTAFCPTGHLFLIPGASAVLPNIQCPLPGPMSPILLLFDSVFLHFPK